MQIIAICSIWQQPSLAPTLQPVLSYKQIIYRMTVISTSRKKKKKKKKRKKTLHSSSIFETLESFETEHYFLA